MSNTTGSGDSKSTSWKIRFFCVVQVLILVGIVNPWSSLIALASLTILVLDLIILLGWCFPVFLYQLVKKKETVRKSSIIALNEFMDIFPFARF